MTAISLFSCYSIASRPWSSPRVTSVMRDTVASMVSATDRLSMLKPRPLKSPATRARTPNSFSTRMEIVCRIRLPSRLVPPMPREDLHHLVLARELELLEPLLLHLFLRGEVELLLRGPELPFEVDVLLVVVPQLRLALEQGGDQLLVLSLHTEPSHASMDSDGNTGRRGGAPRPPAPRTRPAVPRSRASSASEGRT